MFNYLVDKGIDKSKLIKEDQSHSTVENALYSIPIAKELGANPCTDSDYRFIMCVRFPNWNQCAFNYGDEGFVTVRYVFEGTDKWFDGKDFVPYKDTNIIFMKFCFTISKKILF